MSARLRRRLDELPTWAWVTLLIVGALALLPVVLRAYDWWWRLIWRASLMPMVGG